MELKPEKISQVIRSQIKNYQNAIIQNETGTVLTVGDGISRVSGLVNCMAGELLEFENGTFGMAQNLDGGRVYCGASRQGPLPWVLLLWGLTANRTDPGSSTPIPIAIQPLGFPSPVGLGVTLGGRQSKLNRPTTGNLPVIKKEIEKGYLSDR